MSPYHLSRKPGFTLGSRAHGPLALVLPVSRQFRLAVVHLQLVSHICRQLSQNLVAAEHVLLFIIADGLVVPEQFVVASLHARQFLDEFVEACAPPSSLKASGLNTMVSPRIVMRGTFAVTSTLLA